MISSVGSNMLLLIYLHTEIQCHSISAFSGVQLYGTGNGSGGKVIEYRD